jgi:hypothetical protein
VQAIEIIEARNKPVSPDLLLSTTSPSFPFAPGAVAFSAWRQVYRWFIPVHDNASSIFVKKLSIFLNRARLAARPPRTIRTGPANRRLDGSRAGE